MRLSVSSPTKSRRRLRKQSTTTQQTEDESPTSDDGVHGASFIALFSYVLKVDGKIVAGGDGDFEESIGHPFNCDKVADGRCVPLNFEADDFGDDNEVYMIDFDSGTVIWDAVGFEPNSAEQCSNSGHDRRITFI